MTTSSFTETCVPSSFEKGKMYQATDDANENLIVLCTFQLKASIFFEGVVIHQGKSSFPIGTHINGFRKCCFTDFHGEVILKS